MVLKGSKVGFSGANWGGAVSGLPLAAPGCHRSSRRPGRSSGPGARQCTGLQRNCLAALCQHLGFGAEHHQVVAQACAIALLHLLGLVGADLGCACKACCRAIDAADARPSPACFTASSTAPLMCAITASSSAWRPPNCARRRPPSKIGSRSAGNACLARTGLEQAVQPQRVQATAARLMLG